MQIFQTPNLMTKVASDDADADADADIEPTTKPPAAASLNNLEIFDKAAAIVEANPRKYEELPSGETISYREYNAGQPNILVMLPGFMADDTMSSIFAALPEFQDHHIIAVNPRGWYGSTMNTPIDNHEDNADEIMELLKILGIEKAMVGGYSTGGGIAFYMAKKYPETISTAFLMHSIPLHGMKPPFLDENGNPVGIQESVEQMDAMFSDPADFVDTMFETLKAELLNPEGFPPSDHKISEYWTEAAINMPGKLEAMTANIEFNVTPIKTHHAEPSTDLQGLKSKVIVIHSQRDKTVPGEAVEYVTKLAIADEWAPPGKLSYYDDGGSHMIVLENPRAFASVYRKALEEQVLSN